MMVIIVNDPDKGVCQDNLRALNFNGYERCPHLRGDKPGKFSCAIHDRSWYHETPCASHGQIERSVNTRCRTGVYMMKEWREKKLIFPPLDGGK